VRSAVLAGAVPPYLYQSDDNPDGGLDDATIGQFVPFEVSGQRSHELIKGSELVLIEGGPHGLNASHPEEFNRALVGFLAR
jgi:pimeloyl-ACP methyl ester carboxylesterase